MKNKLITAALATMIACASLPALSQGETPGDAAPVRSTTRMTTIDDSSAPDGMDAPVDNSSMIMDQKPYEPADKYSPIPRTVPADNFAPIDDFSTTDRTRPIDMNPPVDTSTPVESPRPIDMSSPMDSEYITPSERQLSPADRSELDRTAPLPTVEYERMESTTDKTTLSPLRPTGTVETNDVATVTPFSAEANFMSKPGLLRYQTYANSGIWMSRAESVAAVSNKIDAASR